MDPQPTYNNGLGIDPWKPGEWGKGYLGQDKLYHWSVGQRHDGYPFHSTVQKVTGHGMQPDKQWNWHGKPTADFWIDPQGRVAFWNRPGMDAFVKNPKAPTKYKLKEIGRQIKAQDPRLHPLTQWIDDAFYPEHEKDDEPWPCRRCHNPVTNADGSCPKCNYRPENGTLWHGEKDPWDFTKVVDKVQQVHEKNREKQDLDAAYERYRQRLLEHDNKLKSCPECQERLNGSGDCINSRCYLSPDFHGGRDTPDWSF